MKKFIALAIFVFLTACASSAQRPLSFEEQKKKNRAISNGLAKIIAGTVALKTGAQFDYNINDRIDAYEDQGMSHAAAVARASSDSKRIMNRENYENDADYQAATQQQQWQLQQIQAEQSRIQNEMRRQEIEYHLRRSYPNFYK